LITEEVGVQNSHRGESDSYILLAEDDIDDQEILIEALQDQLPGIRVHVENNGNRAIDFLNHLPANETPALIILDYNLPELNGAEVLNSITSSNLVADVVKIVWSTSDSPFYRKSCLNLGATAYFVKPSSISGIKEMARMMLELSGLK
jgi:CheY-like chemotaxis protein